MIQTTGVTQVDSITFAKLLKLPNVIKPLDSAGVGHTAPASGEGI